IRQLLGNYLVKSCIYHYYRSEYKQAEEFLTRVAASSDPAQGSDEAVALHYLTHTYLSAAERDETLGEDARAAETYARAAALRPSFPDIHYRLGRARQRAGNLPGPIAAFSSSVALNPRYRAPRMPLAFGLLPLDKREVTTGAF